MLRIFAGIILFLFMSAAVHARQPDDFIKLEFRNIDPEAGEIWVEPVTGMKFVWIPSGCFMMGISEKESMYLMEIYGRDAWESSFGDLGFVENPQRRVCVDGFWMGMFEVTNAQFRKFRPAHDSGSDGGQSLNGDTRPAVMVSRDEAGEFTRWLSGFGNGKLRLPTEAEWEYVARAGSTGRFHWGESEEQACSYGNFHDLTSRKLNSFDDDYIPFPCDDGFGVTAPVGSFRPNRFGVYDMFGNAGEWCEDWFDEEAYKILPQKNPLKDRKAMFNYRCVRGSSWRNCPELTRASARDYDLPDAQRTDIGLRVVRLPGKER